MDSTKTWIVTVFIDEHDNSTRARARLTTPDTGVSGVGTARRNPSDSDVPEIGDELATARALADLAHELIGATVTDIDGVTGTRPSVTL